MTIDERLERLAERHQVLAESVESLAAPVHNIRTLARIAEIHERRLTDLEGGST